MDGRVDVQGPKNTCEKCQDWQDESTTQHSKYSCHHVWQRSGQQQYSTAAEVAYFAKGFWRYRLLIVTDCNIGHSTMHYFVVIHAPACLNSSFNHRYKENRMAELLSLMNTVQNAVHAMPMPCMANATHGVNAPGNTSCTQAVADNCIFKQQSLLHTIRTWMNSYTGPGPLSPASWKHHTRAAHPYSPTSCTQKSCKHMQRRSQ